MYCTVEDMRRVLPEKVTIGDDNIGTPTPGRQSTKRSNITPQEAQYYIGYAQQYIDSRLRPYYSTPLRRTKSFETYLEDSVSAGTDVTITVHDSGSFSIGTLVRLQGLNEMETATVTNVPSLTTFVVNSLKNSYSSSNGKVSIIEFPDPIPVMAARFACGFLLDRLFSAEQSPDVSTYGRTQRNLGKDAMDDVLSGEILLFGQEHTGRRFLRGSLFDAYKSPATVEKGQERE